MSIVQMAPGIVVAPLLGALGADAPVICWRNLADSSQITAFSEKEAHPASNLGNTSTAERWESAVTTATFLVAEWATPSTVDSVAVAGQNWGSGRRRVSIQKPNLQVPGAWLNIVSRVFLPSDGNWVCLFDPVIVLAIRVIIEPETDIAVPTDYPRAAVLYVGEALRIPSGISAPHTPIPMGRITETLTGKAQSGAYLGQIVTRETLEGMASFKDLDEAWFRESMDPFLAAYGRVAFFFAWAPLSRPSEIGYCFTKGTDPQPSLNDNNRFDLTLVYWAAAV